MGQKEKLIARLRSRPKDFTYDEAASLLAYFGYNKSNAGKTSGSRVAFIKQEHIIRLHRPHPGNELKRYQLNQLLEELEGRDLL